MSIVTQDRPAAVTAGHAARRAPRAVEVRIRHLKSGDWEIERESESRPGLVYLIRVTNGQASHDDGPSCPLLVCEAHAHGKPCRHLQDAPALVECGEIVSEMLADIAVERADYVAGESQERIIDRRQRIDDAVWDAERRYGVRITKVEEEAQL